MCLRPKKIYVNGIYKNDTYRGKKGDSYDIDVFAKCGRCSQCINEKSNNWVCRNYFELKSHKQISFITLTYADDVVFLSKTDVQLFLKRFRKHLDKYYNKVKIRYFVAGEYGTLHHRPHIHIIVYGWQEKSENLTYLGINKKSNAIYESKAVKTCWSFGRTTYQEFNFYEIPYVTLYNTPALETFKGYIIYKDKFKELKKHFKDKVQCSQLRKIRLLELSNYIKQINKEKLNSICVKEFNMWSLALGWENYYKEYQKQSIKVFEEYINDKEFVTPSPWVKKLANAGDIYATKEMEQRTKMIKDVSEKQLRDLNCVNVSSNHKKDIIDFNSKKDTIIF